MATSKNSKEVFVVTCHEIPETVCVETRFITQAAVNKPNQYEHLFYISNKNGKLEMTRQEDHLTTMKTSTNLSNPNTFTLSIQSKASSSQPAAAILPLTGTSITNVVSNKNDLNIGGNINVFTNATANKNPLKSTVVGSAPHTQQTFNLGASVLPVITLGTTNTLNRPLCQSSVNDQTQQTDVSTLNMKSVAIQCKLDEEMYDVCVDWPPISEEPLDNEINTELEIETFLKFVKDNSAQHNNLKECLICGEVCKSKKLFYAHMAIHLGPRILCFKCGKYLDNEKLLDQHNCRKVQLLQKAFLKCPHHSCSVVAISHLELYDHLNEHDNNRMYKCSACGRGFCTGQEFLRHILIRAKCYTSAKRKRFHVYGVETEKERLCRVRVFTLHTFKKRTILVKTFLSQRVTKQRLCRICLRCFTNNSVYNRHRTKCLTKFRKRLLRKRYGKANA